MNEVNLKFFGCTFNFAHGEDGDGESGRKCPRDQMKVMRLGFDGFVTPFQSRSQEPGQSQYDPPQIGRHFKVIEQHEEDRTSLSLRTLKS